MCLCEFCGRIPHDPRCPNAPDPVPVLTCCLCGEGILEGGEYLDSAKGPVCMDCLEDMTMRELLEIAGERLSKAQGG